MFSCCTCFGVSLGDFYAEEESRPALGGNKKVGRRLGDDAPGSMTLRDARAGVEDEEDEEEEEGGRLFRRVRRVALDEDWLEEARRSVERYKKHAERPLRDSEDVMHRDNDAFVLVLGVLHQMASSELSWRSRGTPAHAREVDLLWRECLRELNDVLERARDYKEHKDASPLGIGNRMLDLELVSIYNRGGVRFLNEYDPPRSLRTEDSDFEVSLDAP